MKFRTYLSPFVWNFSRNSGLRSRYTSRQSTIGVMPPSSEGCTHMKNCFSGQLVR